MKVRRCVTANDAGGRAVVTIDELVAPITVGLVPGGEFHRIWGSDEPAAVPSDGEEPTAAGYFPPVGGYRFGLFTVGPDSLALPADFDLEAGVVELMERLPGMAETVELDNPGMHTTDTVDFVVVLSGEVDLELDDGVEAHLTPGDCVVQNGTRHAWRNRSTEPCVMAVALVGAMRAD
jgi:Cupin domain